LQETNKESTNTTAADNTVVYFIKPPWKVWIKLENDYDGKIQSAKGGGNRSN
jgi:hypothetical protein